MTAPIGKCALCLIDNVELRKSHVIPRWAYTRLRDDRPDENSHPIKIEGGEARFTAKQVKEHLLCCSCEQKLGDYDNYVSKLAYKDGAFPARDSVGPILGADGGLHCAEPGTLDAARLAYFACSVVWRGHIATAVSRCTLGAATVGEVFRAYLNGERAFPSRVAAMLSLLLDDEPGKAQLGDAILMPHSMRKRPHHSHEFALCGMYFAVHTGVAPADVDRSLVAAAPLIALTPRSTYKSWFGSELTSAKFIGRKPPLGSSGLRWGARRP